MGTGAVVRPAEREIRVVKLLPAPDLSGVPAEVLKPAATWAMPTLEGAVAYRVQVSSDEKFDRIVRDLKVASNTADFASLANGSWFARVRGIDPAGLEGFDTVKLIAVKDGIYLWKVSYSSISLAGGRTLLGWTGQQANGQPMPEGAYSAVVARDEALSQVVATPDTATPGRNPRLDLGNLQPGVYFIRLSNKAATGTTNSEVYRFEIPANWGKSVFDLTSSLQPVR